MADSMGLSWREEFMNAGIETALQPRQEQVTDAFGAALRGFIEPAVVAAFIREAAVAPRLCLEGLRETIRSGSDVSSKVLDVVRAALPLLEAALGSASTAEERAEVREQIVTLIREAREEASEHRNFMVGVGKVTAVVAVAAIGAITFLVSGGNHARNRP